MIVQAILSLKPGSKWTLNGDSYSGLEWLDTEITKPTEEELNDEIIRLQDEYDSLEYQRQRAKQYPSLGDQLDMLWHAIDTNSLNKTSDFYTAIKAVKDANPKSE